MLSSLLTKANYIVQYWSI